jgi:hypothetical protein
MTDNDYDLQYKEWCKEQRRIALQNNKRECKATQDRLRCPNCRTLWECRCTLEQQHSAWRRIEAQQQADYARRVRECDERIAESQAAWEKRFGKAE